MNRMYAEYSLSYGNYFATFLVRVFEAREVGCTCVEKDALSAEKREVFYDNRRSPQLF